MATRVIKFPVKDGTESLLVEVEESDVPGRKMVAKPGVAEKARQSLEEALNEVMPGVNAIMSHLGELARKPDEFGLEFGIKFTVEAGAIIAKTALEGNITVKLTWSAAPAA